MEREAERHRDRETVLCHLAVAPLKDSVCLSVSCLSRADRTGHVTSFQASQAPGPAGTRGIGRSWRQASGPPAWILGVSFVKIDTGTASGMLRAWQTPRRRGEAANVCSPSLRLTLFHTQTLRDDSRHCMESGRASLRLRSPAIPCLAS